MVFDAPDYRSRGGAQLRAPTDPGGLELPRLDDPADDPAALGTWLGEVWAREDVRAGLESASPALCRQVEAVVSGHRRQPRQIVKAAVSVASYLLRWQQRSTPFGDFAGIAAVSVGETAELRWGEDHRRSMRADGAWLAGVITRLEECEPLRRRLSVVANDTVHARGARLVAQGVPAGPADELAAPIEVSVRATRPTVTALETARSPISYERLHAHLKASFPDASTHQLDGLLQGLLAQNLLISSLWAPMTCIDALGYLCEELQHVRAHLVGETADEVRELYDLHASLTEPSTAPAASPSRVQHRMATLNNASSTPLMVDTALDCDLRLPAPVVEEAQQAAAVLARLSAYPFGAPHWREYHHRFRQRYGPGALVPVTDLVADSGLGLPATYLGSAREPSPAERHDRDAAVLALIQTAMVDQRDEIALTDDDLEKLSGGDAADLRFPSRVEICVQVQASSMAAVNRGDFDLVVTGTPRPASSMAGRFAHLLGDKDAAELAATYETTDAVAAQLSFTPRRCRNANVARTPQLLPVVISLAEHRSSSEPALGVADLAVTADARRFWLIQRSTGAPIETRTTHALEAGNQTPPLARFLAEIPTARCAAYGPLDLGAAAKLPYLPRIRYRRTILSPARWLLSDSDLPRHDTSTAEWEAGLRDWMQRWWAPERVTVVEHEQHLPLDLSHPFHRLLLRRRLSANGRLELREAPTGDDLSWIGRPHEILLPLNLEQPPEKHPRTALGGPPTVAEPPQLPGASPTLRARLHAHPDRFDEILTDRLPTLLDDLGNPRCWWFTRDRDPMHPGSGPDLSIHFRLPRAEEYGTSAAHLQAWADSVHRDRLASDLTLETYRPQNGRYGAGAAREAAEQVFAADTRAALAQIRMAAIVGSDPAALAAASMVALVCDLAPNPDAGLRWLVSDLPYTPGSVERHQRDQTLELADPYGTYSGLTKRRGGTEVAQAWHQRAETLAVYRAQIVPERKPLRLLPSLLHLHHRRAVNPHPDHEAVVLRLARACALRYTAEGSRP
ncbi:lantibiotic dehydratase [Streptomonospora sediminis]